MSRFKDETFREISWRWSKLMKANNVSDELSKKFFKVLDKKYNSSSRHYHNWRHINDILSHFDEYIDRLSDVNALRWATFYHDVHQSQFSKKNEEKSADLAEKHMIKANLAPLLIESTKDLILRTKSHLEQNIDSNFDACLFLDLDLSILGVGALEYELYAEKIRKEYNLIPGGMYRKGRVKILESFLRSEKIYRLAQFSDYEEQARENISWELNELRK